MGRCESVGLIWLGRRVRKLFGDAGNYRGGRRLEVDQVAYVNFKGIGEAAQNVESHVHRAVLDLPNVRLVRANHEGKLALGQPLLLP